MEVVDFNECESVTEKLLEMTKIATELDVKTETIPEDDFCQPSSSNTSHLLEQINRKISANRQLPAPIVCPLLPVPKKIVICAKKAPSQRISPIIANYKNSGNSRLSLRAELPQNKLPTKKVENPMISKRPSLIVRFNKPVQSRKSAPITLRTDISSIYGPVIRPDL
jgi:hypothetical protein